MQPCIGRFLFMCLGSGLKLNAPAVYPQAMSEAQVQISHHPGAQG